MLSIYIGKNNVGWQLTEFKNEDFTPSQLFLLIEKTNKKIKQCKRKKQLKEIEDYENVINFLKEHPNYPKIDRCIEILG